MRTMAVITLFAFILVLSAVNAIYTPETISQLEAMFGGGDENGEGKLAGAVSTTIDKMPYQVSIRVSNTTACGGFILSESWIMTAAHCVDGAFLNRTVIRAGSSLLNSGGTTFTPEKVEIHSLYNGTRSYDYDFALIKLTSNLTFSNTVKAIGIPTQFQATPLLGSISIGGWGATRSSTSYSTDLKTINITVLPHKLCRIIYGGFATITDRMFCAGNKLLWNGRGTCQGDSGGAAVYQNIVIGVASFGVTCGSPIFPSVFANVASVAAWVRGVTGIK